MTDRTKIQNAEPAAKFFFLNLAEIFSWANVSIFGKSVYVIDPKFDPEQTSMLMTRKWPLCDFSLNNTMKINWWNSAEYQLTFHRSEFDRMFYLWPETTSNDFTGERIVLKKGSRTCEQSGFRILAGRSRS